MFRRLLELYSGEKLNYNRLWMTADVRILQQLLKDCPQRFDAEASAKAVAFRVARSETPEDVRVFDLYAAHSTAAEVSVLQCSRCVHAKYVYIYVCELRVCCVCMITIYMCLCVHVCERVCVLCVLVWLRTVH